MTVSAPAFPDGHFYSPVVDTDEATRDADRIWPQGDLDGPMVHMMINPPLEPVVKGIDWNHLSHENLLGVVFPSLIDAYDYPSEGDPDESLTHFHDGNGQFGPVDGRVLFCMLRMIRPRRIIEVGSGYSTLLMTDINERFFDESVKITSVEPFPRPFLNKLGAAGKINLLQQRAQDVPQSLFDTLQSGDVLFIDSSHVCKTGSDVNRLILDVLPRLNAGVYIHLHDIFFPSDYPREWVIDGSRSWSEQYLLQALLTGSQQFEIIYGCSLAHAFHRELLVNFFGKMVRGGSLWLRRTDA